MTSTCRDATRFASLWPSARATVIRRSRIVPTGTSSIVSTSVPRESLQFALSGRVTIILRSIQRNANGMRGRSSRASRTGSPWLKKFA